VELFLDYGKFPERPPSSIVDMRSNPPQLLRRGSSAPAVEAAIREWINIQ
jgi:tRNA A37 threonylcarbamoyladenosine synthetase subunit TsaC/SUA5/YrdC